MEQPEPNTIVSAILCWYASHARDLPWRRTRDPYAIHVSEIMLQQTQVKTVIGYWERWMRALPDLQSLAAAESEVIHKLWEGLGYYTRVRNLQAAARLILEKHAGIFPEDYDDLLALPGVGPYTAGAIASIAFNQPQPLLDGNVARILTRIFGIGGDPRKIATREELWRLARRLVEAAATGDGPNRCSQLNQSLMELGALVCTPRQPKCSTCPVSKVCVARLTGRVEELPHLPPRAAATARRFAAFILQRGGKYLVRQRAEGAVNARLWEFPNAEYASGGKNHPESLGRQKLGWTLRDFQSLGVIKHSITRYRITLEVYRARLPVRAKIPAPTGRWLTLKQMDRLAFTAAHRKILDQLQTTR